MQRRFRDAEGFGTARQTTGMAFECISDQRSFKCLDSFRKGPWPIVDFVAKGRRTAFDAENTAIGDVAQFAHVARPTVTEQCIDARRIVGRHRTAMAGCRLQKEMLEQQRDVLAPFAQGGQRDGGNAQAIVQIATETPVFGALEQVFLGGGDDAAIDRDRGVRTEPFQRTFLQDPE